MARGEYVALLGGDDISLPHRVEQQLDQIERGYDIVFSLPRLIDDRSRELPYYRFPIFFRENFESEAELLRTLFLEGNFLCGPSAMARRSFFERHGIYRRGLIQLQDFDLWVRACREGARMRRFEDPIVRYRVRDGEGNLSGPRNKNRTPFELVSIYRDILEGTSHSLLREAFPHDMSARSSDDLLAREADILFLYLNHPKQLVRSVGIERAVAWLDDEDRSRELAGRGFGPAELFQIMSETHFCEH
ncbi:putative teichoic acid/polysaccharide glycosyl transferase, family 2 [Lutibaculum baratangense AMV1]|uniref:Putative teichoic acid/polysaccharide glycosyl transferase, family 2 n=2 Tax=Lutibaculum TaxID=1358438 RepID=V4R675_9HYPH|nr:putative teichoic acid/polysaccharide glycosyl transferase, family 2 [Lutibaculum baratangense AMV1]